MIRSAFAWLGWAILVLSVIPAWAYRARVQRRERIMWRQIDLFANHIDPSVHIGEHGVVTRTDEHGAVTTIATPAWDGSDTQAGTEG